MNNQQLFSLLKNHLLETLLENLYVVDILFSTTEIATRFAIKAIAGKI
jgi:hypothetical protein